MSDPSFTDGSPGVDPAPSPQPRAVTAVPAHSAGQIAIDGPSGSGKSTVARELARRHGWAWVDTGAMYRALTWWVLARGIALDDAAAIGQLAADLPLELSTDPDRESVSVDGVDITSAIRSGDVTAAVSAVSAVAVVRAVMVERQRAMAAAGGIVMEGRDIGSVVLPAADVKVYLTARAGERAARRSREGAGQLAAVADAMARRDRIDSGRAVSPLTEAAGAIVIDSSELSVDDVVARIEQALDALPPPTPQTHALPQSVTELTADRQGGAGLAAIGARDPSNAPGVAIRAASPTGLIRAKRFGSGTREGPLLRRVRRLAQVVFRLVFRITVIGAENLPDGPLLLAGNHTGFLDGPLVFIYLPRPAAFLAKSELFGGPWARLLRAVNQVPVHRGTPDRTALTLAVDIINDGGLVGMFPEGARGEGKLETIQDGVGYIACRTGCSIVPVVCRGTAEALPEGRLLPHLRTPIDIVFGEAFSVATADPATRLDMHAAAERIAAELRQLIDRVEAT